ncbi:MAG: hypothetical protein R2751_09865 [Bacteroidales bacterium]
MNRAIFISLAIISLSVISCNVPGNELMKLIPTEDFAYTSDTLYLTSDTTLVFNGRNIDFQALDNELMQLDSSRVVLKTNVSVTVGVAVEIMNVLNQNSISVKVVME